jgi:hypothetical protein
MHSAHCVECARLWYDSAALMLQYGAALDALSLTPQYDEAYARRKIALREASQALFEAERLERVHQDSHRQFLAKSDS